MKLDIAGLPTASRARQPTPYEGQSGTPCVINAYRATRPAGQNLTVRSQTLKKKLNGIGASHAPDLITYADPAALVSAPNGIFLDMVMKYCARYQPPIPT